jgi:hypothetical protein
MRRARIRTGAVLLALAVVASCSDDDQSAATTTSERTDPPTTPAGDASPEDVAMGFLDAYGAFDADRAMSYLTDEAIAEMSGSAAGANTREEFRLELALLEAGGYEHTISGCEQHGDSTSGVDVRCAYDFHAIRSDEIGLGPYSDNYWDLTVLDGTIVSAANTIAYMANGFSQQMWEPFAHWIATKYPDDVLRMYDSFGQTNSRLTEESVQLWEERSRQYAQEVGQSAPASTSP